MVVSMFEKMEVRKIGCLHGNWKKSDIGGGAHDSCAVGGQNSVA